MESIKQRQSTAAVPEVWRGVKVHRHTVTTVSDFATALLLRGLPLVKLSNLNFQVKPTAPRDHLVNRTVIYSYLMTADPPLTRNRTFCMDNLQKSI